TSSVDYQSLAECRYLIRRFLASSEELAKGKGMTPQQHLLMLAIAGRPAGEEPTIRYLADRLRIKHHSAVGLVDRLGAQGLIEREHSSIDRRQVFVRLTKQGAAVLENLSASHRQELRTLAPRLVDALRAVVSSS
ncbi:MAG: MarR family winged helix-turn-helix transcriptional regulator, partial [Chloroflexota bacterium]